MSLKFARKEPFAKSTLFENLPQVVEEMISDIGLRWEKTYVLKSPALNKEITVKWGSKKQTEGGDAAFNFDRDRIYVAFDEDWDYTTLYSSISHELQHFFESLKMPYYKDLPSTEYRSWDKKKTNETRKHKRHLDLADSMLRPHNGAWQNAYFYVNTPTEVRAFIAEITNHINLYPKAKQWILNSLRESKNKGYTLVSLLRTNERFEAWFPLFSSENRKYVIKEIYKDLMRGENND